MKKGINHILCFLLIVLFIQACKVPTKSILPASDPLPKNFIVAADSTNIGMLSRELFFENKELTVLIDTVLKNNQDIQMAIQRISMSKSNWFITKGLTLPSLTGGATAGVEKFGNYTMNGLGNYDMNLSPNINKDQQIPTVMPDLFLGFRSSWEADIWGKLADNKRAGYLKYLASEKGKQWLITQLVAQVASLYYELLTLDKEVQIIEKNILLQENALEIVKIQKQGGRATELAVQQFNAQLLGTKSVLYFIKQMIVETENALKIISGKYDLSIERKKDIAELMIPSIIKAGIPSLLITQRPDIQAAELLLVAAGADVDASRKAFLPSLNLTAFTALNSFNAGFFISPQSIAFGILGGLTAPLLNKNVLKGNYQLASATEKEAFYQYQKMIITAFQEIQTLLKGVDNYKQIHELKIQETNSLFSAVSTSKELYANGFASYLEVITAQRGVLDAELESIKNKKMVFTQIIGLYRSLGGGWQ